MVIVMDENPENSSAAETKKKNLRKRYNRMVVIDLKKRSILRNLVKQNTLCEHKQVYTHANAICRRISPKDVVAAEMNKRLNKLEGSGQSASFEVTMANVSYASNALDNDNGKGRKHDDDASDKYSESYWAEVI